MSNRRAFAISTSLQTQLDNSQVLRVTVVGVSPVTKGFTNSRPVIRSIGSSPSSGSLAGGKDYFAAIVGIDASGRWSARSNVVRVTIPAGTNTNAVLLSDISYPSGSNSYAAFLSDDANSLRLAFQSAAAQLDPAVNLGTLPALTAAGIPPDSRNIRLRVKAKPAVNLGVLRGAIANVAADSVGLTAGTIQTDNQFVGRTFSLVGRGTDGLLPVADFVITGSSASGNNLTLTPDPSGILLAGDLFVIRTKATAVTSSSITDEAWINSSMPAGLAPNQDVGKVLRIIDGTGAGQVRQIVANDGTTHTVGRAFDVTPDLTSSYVVEDSAYLWQAESPIIDNSDPSSTIAVQLSVKDFTSTDIVIIGVLAADGLESDEAAAPFRELSIITPIAAMHAGVNLLSNPDFEAPPNSSADIAAAGWFLAVNDQNAWNLSRDPGTSYSGTASVKAHLLPGITIADTASLTAHFYARQLFGIKPGESFYLSVYGKFTLRAGQPAGLTFAAYIFLLVTYADGTFDGIFGTNVDPAANEWVKVSGRVSVPTDRGTPISMQAGVMAVLSNATGAAYTTQGPLEADINFDGVQLLKVSDANTLVNGSVLPSQGLAVNVTQNSNSGGSCLIGLSWNAQSVPLSNRDYFNAAASGTPRIFSGLQAGRTYYFYFYGLAIDGTVHLGSGDTSTPPTAPDGNAALACYYDGRYPLGFITVTTPSVDGGTGSGSGSSGTICPEGQELVDIQGKGGVMKAIEAQLGDYIRGEDVRTGEPIYRQIVGKMVQRSSTWRIVNGRRVSPCHDVWIDGKWQQPFRIGSFDTTPGDRVQLSVDTATYDDQNFVLVDEQGATMLILHNAPIQS